MALRYVRIGSMNNIHVYDDADFDGGVETDDVVKVGSAPVDPEDVLRLDDVGGVVGSVVGPALSTDRAAARWVGAGGDELDDSAVIIEDGGSINIPTGQDYRVNNIQVVTDQQAAEADVAAVSAISLAAGTDQVDRTTFNTDLTTLVTEINAIRTKLNNLLAKIRTHGLIDT